MDWETALFDECELLKTRIERGNFNPRKDTERIRNLYKQVDENEKTAV